MAPGEFTVTPGNFNSRYEFEFRQKAEKVQFEELEKTRTKIKKINATTGINASHNLGFRPALSVDSDFRHLE